MVLNRGTALIVSICPFSRWAEVKIISTLNSTISVRFLYEKLVCRYGLPDFIHIDLRMEFSVEFW